MSIKEIINKKVIKNYTSADSLDNEIEEVPDIIRLDTKINPVYSLAVCILNTEVC